MTNSIGWEVHSMKSLSLFDQGKLDTAQLHALPAPIREKIYKGYSDVLNAPRMAASQPKVNRVHFAAKTTEEGGILVSYDGVNFVKAGNLQEFPRLLSAMREAYDEARLLFPTAFRHAKPIGELRLFPNEPGSLLPEVRGVGLDINSAFRNGFTAGNYCAPFVAFSGVAAGSLSLWAGTDIAIREKGKYDRAVLVGDQEGKTQALLNGAGGLAYAMTGTGQLGAFFPSAYDLLPGASSGKAGVDASTGFGYAADGSIIAMSLALAASAIYEWPYVSEFRGKLHKILERDVSQQKKAIEGLEFLQQQICLTEKDWGELADKGLDRDVDAINKKYLEKHDRFVRRVGATVADLVAKSSDLLASVKEGTNPAALQEAKDLIELADRESLKNRVKEITLLLISFLMITATLLSILVVGGDASAILYTINAFCWLSIDSSWLHDKIGGAVHSLFFPSDAKRWGNSVEKRDFLEKILKVFKKEGKWDLFRVRRDFERDLPRTDFHLNGKVLKTFEDCQRELGLDKLDFEARELDETKLDERKKKTLEFLAILNQGVLGASVEDLTAQNPDKLVTHEPDQLSIDAHFNPVRAIGTIHAKKVFGLKKEVEDTSYPRVEARVEVEGSHHRIWTRVA